MIDTTIACDYKLLKDSCLRCWGGFIQALRRGFWGILRQLGEKNERNVYYSGVN